jgi:hypothetical protein
VHKKDCVSVKITARAAREQKYEYFSARLWSH